MVIAEQKLLEGILGVVVLRAVVMGHGKGKKGDHKK